MNGYGSQQVGVVVSISRWRVTVHYVDCYWHRAGLYHDLPLPRKIKVRLCGACRPTEEDVRSAPPEVWWYPYSPDPGRALTRVVRMDAEAIDDIAARRSMGRGKVPARRTDLR